MVVIISHSDVINAPELYTLKWLQWQILCNMYVFHNKKCRSGNILKIDCIKTLKTFQDIYLWFK